MDEQKQTQLEIDLSHEVAQGTYANLTDHSTFNFRVYYRLYPFDARSNETGSKKPDYSDSRKCQTPDVGFTGQYLEI